MGKRLDAERLGLWHQYRRACARIDTELAAEIEAESGVELSSFEVLDLLDRSGGRARMQDLSDALVMNRSTFTRLIDRLDGRGLVSRELTSDDGRGVVAVMTRKGQRAFLRARPVYRRMVQRQFARHLTDTDVAALHRILSKLDSRSE
jgi:DNA-binding MarR family transcriptional regulator